MLTHTLTRHTALFSLDPSAADPALLSVFRVDGRSLRVGPGAGRLDHEAVAVFSLTVRSEDDGAPPLALNATVLVEVKDVNDPPTAVTLDHAQVRRGGEGGWVEG